MSLIPFRPARGAIVIASLALALSVIPVYAQSDVSAPPAMAVEVSGLSSGDVVTGNRIDFTVQPIGYQLSNTAGTPPVEGKGHYHVILDGGLINMFTTPDASVSLQNVAPGPHDLMVVPATNDHMEVMDGAAAIDFDYQPAEQLPEITAGEEAAAPPTVTIVSPAPGESVSGEFDLVISTTDYTLSEELLGKPNVAGYGHWHVFVDAAEGMGTMAGMSGTDTFTVDSSALTPGPHTLIAVLTDNLHAPLDPPVMAIVEVEVAGGAAEAVTAGETIAVSLQEWGLEPSELTLVPGTYTFEATNDGTIPHGFALAGEGVTAATPDATYAVGQSQTFSVELAAGTYEIFCPVPGHKEAGMVANITVGG
ncbi:MAG TPA: plastocyanin/azurin family copper-binding protein [Candidatus Limnocylindrales bacterium]|nr:plastocyanin/azurin family copper-binding protein [Candidatus Limnocylindrales bacterium]